MPQLEILNKYRVRDGQFASPDSFGFTGAFILPINNVNVKIIASDQGGWKHVSVSLAQNRNFTPSWQIMCVVKDLFFEPEEVAMQLHPPKSQYVNNHPGCLHLWAPLNATIPLPPKEFVGFTELNPKP